MMLSRHLLSKSLQSRCSSGYRSVSSVSVVGSGQMGTGIALVAANTAGLPVTLIDSSEKQLDKARSFVAKWCDKEISKNRMDEAKKSLIVEGIQLSTDLKSASDADIVIEAASENFDVKKSIFQTLAEITKSNAILASNTSSISISKIAGVVGEVENEKATNVIGMHFMNPVPVMKLVEVISALQTSEDTLQRTKSLAENMNKTCTFSKDVPGFIANRVLMPYINEAIFTLYEGIGTREDIDVTMKLGTNVPMGPLTLADFIGLDTCLAIMKVLHTELGDSKYRPCPLLVNYVHAGYLGKKTGRGFYEY